MVEGRGGRTPKAKAASGVSTDSPAFGVFICFSLASKAAILSDVLLGRPWVLIRDSVVGLDVSVPRRPLDLDANCETS